MSSKVKYPSFLQRSTAEVLKETNALLGKVLSSNAETTTEMIRKGQFVHGRVLPVEKQAARTS